METQNETDLCFPQLPNNSCKKPTFHWNEAVFLNILLFFISLITVTLNLLVIISVSHFRRLQNPTNTLLLSLSVSDFLIGFFTLPVEILRITTCWLLGDIICSFYYYMSCLILSASTVNIVLLSFDRYVAICDPLHYPTRITMAKVKCGICLCWCWSAFYGIFYNKDILIQPGSGNSCIGECALSFNDITSTVDLIFNIMFPFFICVFFIRVLVVAVSQVHAMRSHVTAVRLQVSVNLGAKKSELKAVRTLGVLVIIYLISFCPYYWFSVFQVDSTNTSNASFLLLLFYFNSFLNPVIYAFFYPWYRKAAKLIISLQILQPGSCDANIH